jgi:hypothetical protein
VDLFRSRVAQHVFQTVAQLSLCILLLFTSFVFYSLTIHYWNFYPLLTNSALVESKTWEIPFQLTDLIDSAKSLFFDTTIISIDYGYANYTALVTSLVSAAVWVVWGTILGFCLRNARNVAVTTLIFSAILAIIASSSTLNFAMAFGIMLSSGELLILADRE